LKYSKYHKDSVYEKDIAETETDFARGFITGFRYVTQWNSSDEEPERETYTEWLHLSIDVIFYNYKEYYIGHYNSTRNKWYSKEGSEFDKIDGWQYLPEIK